MSKIKQALSEVIVAQSSMMSVIAGRPSILVRTIFLYAGVGALVFAFNERLRYELYGNLGVEGIDPFFFSVGIIVIAIVLISLVPNFFNVVKRTVSTGEEISNDLLRQQLDEVRRQLITEKDEELAVRLREQEEKIRLELKGYVGGDLRNPSGDISDDWRDALLLSRNRLVSESDHLKSRSRSNLLWGVLFSIGTVLALVLVVFVFPPETRPSSILEFLFFFGPRATLVIIIQILANFFLKMYIGSEREIARNRNELTNVELRIAAGLMSMNSPSGLDELAKILAAEERNFVFLKNEKIMSANSRSDINEIVEIARSLSGKKG